MRRDYSSTNQVMRLLTVNLNFRAIDLAPKSVAGLLGGTREDRAATTMEPPVGVRRQQNGSAEIDGCQLMGGILWLRAGGKLGRERHKNTSGGFFRRGVGLDGLSVARLRSRPRQPWR